MNAHPRYLLGPALAADMAISTADSVVLFPQLLVAIAAGKRAAPQVPLIQWNAELDALCSMLADRSAALDGMRFDFSMPASVTGDDFEDVHVAVRCTALRQARKLWSACLQRLVGDLLRAEGICGWSERVDAHWHHWQPQDHRFQRQGWKLHVSATPNSAPQVLAACAPVLLQHAVAFKHAVRIEQVESLASAKCSRGNGGKFITVYPKDVAQARILAQALHHASIGLPGPEILSDQRYASDSLVHFRYGLFVGEAELNNDGAREARLVAPGGERVADVRRAWCETPAWVEPLFAADQDDGREKPRTVMLRDRYRVTGAIRHANRGGVYRGVDTQTGGAVIIKQARPHTAAEITGFDAVAALQIEGASLRHLAGLAPQWIDEFVDQGHQFMVQAQVEGRNLRDWLVDRCEYSADARPGLPQAERLQLAQAIAALLAQVHERGLVCRDFNPNNLIIGADRALTLIDTELLARPGSFVFRYYTYGFAAPELLAAERAVPCPEFSADVYSLGAVLYFLCSGTAPPVFLNNDRLETLQQRWRIGIQALVDAGDAHWASLILDLVEVTPERRPSAQQVLARLMAMADGGFPTTMCSSAAPLWPLERLMHDGVNFIIDTCKHGARDRLWSSGSFGDSTDACNVQHGAAGVLDLLCRQPRRDAGIAAVIGESSKWIADRISARSTLLPGLYFGAAGAAWSLLQSARSSNDSGLRAQAVQALLRLPTSWPNPDICHGTAGAGLALCEGWRETGDPRLRTAISACADSILAQVAQHEYGIHWRVASDFDSALKGVEHYGFAHGVAGIGYFLLLAAQVLGREDCWDAARRAGETLVRVADVGLYGARWRSSVGAPPAKGRDMNYYWCSGASGVGSFLVRLWHTHQQACFRELAEQAATAVHRMRWHAGTSMCHGLAGNGEFLLDMAQWVDPHYRVKAEDLAACLQFKTATRGDSILVVDESEMAVTADFNTGLSGVLSFLDRLQRGGTRAFMVDDLLTR